MSSNNLTTRPEINVPLINAGGKKEFGKQMYFSFKFKQLINILK